MLDFLRGKDFEYMKLQEADTVIQLLHTENLISTRVSPDLKWIVSGDVENRLWIWEMSSGELKWVVGGTQEGIKKIEVSDDFKWIIVADYGIVRIWNTENHKLAAVLNKKSQIFQQPPLFQNKARVSIK